MATQQLRVVPAGGEAPRPVIRRHEEDQVGPLFFSVVGETDLLCGACSFLLIRGVGSAAAIMDALVECPNCSALNEAPDLGA